MVGLLYLAVAHYSARTMRMLLEAGAAPDLPAVCEGAIETALYNVSQGLDIERLALCNRRAVAQDQLAAERHGASKIATALLEHGAGVNQRRTDDFTTPLHALLLNICHVAENPEQYSERIQTVKALLLAKADMNAVCADGTTPLHAAYCSGSLDCVRLLLEAGSELIKCDPLCDMLETRCGLMFGQPILQVHRLHGGSTLARCLAGDYGDYCAIMGCSRPPEHPDETARDQPEPTIHDAVISGGIECLLALLKRQERLPGHDAQLALCHPESNETALQHAAAAGEVECVRLLLQHGAQVDAAGKDELLHNRRIFGRPTPLYLSCVHGHSKCTELLADGGGMMLPSPDAGVIALLASCEEGNADCARVLLGHGVLALFVDDILDKEHSVSNIDMLFDVTRDAACIQALIDHGVVALCGVDMVGKLFRAICTAGYVSCLELLLEQEAVPVDAFCARSSNPEDSDDSPLAAACEAGHMNCVRALLRAGATFTRDPDKEAHTLVQCSHPLRGPDDVVVVAFLNGRLEYAVALLNAGVSVTNIWSILMHPDFPHDISYRIGVQRHVSSEHVDLEHDQHPAAQVMRRATELIRLGLESRRVWPCTWLRQLVELRTNTSTQFVEEGFTLLQAIPNFMSDSSTMDGALGLAHALLDAALATGVEINSSADFFHSLASRDPYCLTQHLTPLECAFEKLGRIFFTADQVKLVKLLICYGAKCSTFENNGPTFMVEKLIEVHTRHVADSGPDHSADQCLELLHHLSGWLECLGTSGLYPIEFARKHEASFRPRNTTWSTVQHKRFPPSARATIHLILRVAEYHTRAFLVRGRNIGLSAAPPMPVKIWLKIFSYLTWSDWPILFRQRGFARKRATKETRGTRPRGMTRTPKSPPFTAMVSSPSAIQQLDLEYLFMCEGILVDDIRYVHEKRCFVTFAIQSDLLRALHLNNMVYTCHARPVDTLSVPECLSQLHRQGMISMLHPSVDQKTTKGASNEHTIRLMQRWDTEMTRKQWRKQLQEKLRGSPWYSGVNDVGIGKTKIKLFVQVAAQRAKSQKHVPQSCTAKKRSDSKSFALHDADEGNWRRAVEEDQRRELSRSTASDHISPFLASRAQPLPPRAYLCACWFHEFRRRHVPSNALQSHRKHLHVAMFFVYSM